MALEEGEQQQQQQQQQQQRDFFFFFFFFSFFFFFFFFFNFFFLRRGARGRIVSAPLLVPLGDPPLQQGRYPPLRVVVPAFDGFLYAISGDGACSDSIDLGEASYSRPLADDIDGDGSLEIVLATMSGSVHASRPGGPG